MSFRLKISPLRTRLKTIAKFSRMNFNKKNLNRFSLPQVPQQRVGYQLSSADSPLRTGLPGHEHRDVHHQARRQVRRGQLHVHASQPTLRIRQAPRCQR